VDVRSAGIPHGRPEQNGIRIRKEVTMNADRGRGTVGKAGWLRRPAGWFCAWLVLPPLVALGQSADSPGQPEVPPPEKILATLRPEHPRVMAVPATFDAVRAAVRGGGLPARIYAEVKKSADQTLAAPVPTYEKPDGKRLLSVSRRVLDRVRTLALVYQRGGGPPLRGPRLEGT
jgi:hypothetical protein